MKVIDLFAGVGGMSLGAAKAGFTLAGAVELDPIAIETHQQNFPNSAHLKCDVSSLKGDDLKRELKLKRGELTGIIGGPPCQGFSSMGRRDIEDPRNSLFIHYFRLVGELQPDFFVAENVLGILDSKYDKIRKEALSLLEKKYILLQPITISAKDLGAPTTRTRVFFIGVKKSHKAIATKIKFGLQLEKYNFVKDALLGLSDEVSFNEEEWVSTEKHKDSYIAKISRLIPEGVGDPESIERFLLKSEVSGMVGTRHTKEVIQRFEMVLEGQTDKVSRAPRLRQNGFCPTLRAGTNKDRGSYQAVRPIHPTQHRVITPREAARLQGFPDWFQFHKTKWHSFRQIGNSVSPIVSEHILRQIKEVLFNI